MKPSETVLIAITFADDTIGIMAFVTTEYAPDGQPRWSRAPMPDAVDAEIARSAFDPNKRPIKSWRFVARQEIPGDRTYRDALRDRQKKLVHDMPAAREIHREMIRVARVPKLLALDVAFQRAIESASPNAQGRVVKQKQTLRDLTKHPAIDAAQTVDELKAFWPDELT